MREMLKSKIHSATLTETELEYEGSVTIDRALMEAADLAPFEKVLVANLSNGDRLETYVIEGKPGSGTICLNGAAARRAQSGDRIIIMSFCLVEDGESKNWQPTVVVVDEKNRITGTKR